MQTLKSRCLQIKTSQNLDCHVKKVPQSWTWTLVKFGNFDSSFNLAFTTKLFNLAVVTHFKSTNSEEKNLFKLPLSLLFDLIDLSVPNFQQNSSGVLGRNPNSASAAFAEIFLFCCYCWKNLRKSHRTLARSCQKLSKNCVEF